MSLNNNAAINEMVNDLDAIGSASEAEKYANWSYIDGNSVEFTYADGAKGRIVTAITYKTGLTTVLVRTFTYNANDEVTAISASLT